MMEQEGNFSPETILYHLNTATYTGQTWSIINELAIQVLLLPSMSTLTVPVKQACNCQADFVSLPPKSGTRQ